MARLGVKNYRFSLSWPRILPQGVGAVNEEGVAFYNRLIDALLANGIRPFVTLFHWDYPQALAERGAWANPDSPKWFEAYVSVCARRFGNRVKDFITLNEPQCFIGLGYGTGAHAPGLMLPAAATIPMSHHVLKAHGLAVRALRSLVPDCRVGYAPCGDAAIPFTSAPADVEAARKAYFDVPTGDFWAFNVAWWSDPVMLGHYPESGRHFFGALPQGWENDLTLISQPLDFYAQNIYNGRFSVPPTTPKAMKKCRAQSANRERPSAGRFARMRSIGGRNSSMSAIKRRSSSPKTACPRTTPSRSTAMCMIRTARITCAAICWPIAARRRTA